MAKKVETAGKNLSPMQFYNMPVKVPAPTIDNGWLGPMGSYGEPDSAGSLYGYGTSSDVPYGN